MLISSVRFRGGYSPVFKKTTFGLYKYFPVQPNFSSSKRSPVLSYKMGMRNYNDQGYKTDKDKTVMLICYGEGAQTYRTFVDAYTHQFEEQAQNFEIRHWPGDKDGIPVDLTSPSIVKLLHDVQLAVVWSPPMGFFELCPQLKLITVLGAGVPLMTSPLVNTLPPSVPITRLVDPIAAKRMANYVLNAVLNITLKRDRLMKQQQNKVWDDSFMKEIKDVNDITVGIMGLGTLGSSTANTLKTIGFQVIGWKRKKTPSTTTKGVKHFYGKEELPEFLRNSEILVILLPLTPETKGIINSVVLGQLPKGASVINCARGGHVVDGDLIHALDCGHIQSAVLDVFGKEPLPDDSPLWVHPKVTITPHIAGWSDSKSGVKQILDNWNRLKEGKPLHNVVDVEARY